MKIVYDSFDRQNRIIVDLIEAAKMESTKREFKVEPVNLHRIIEKLKAEFEPLLIKGKLNMHVLVEGSLPKVKADRKHLEHVLRNLISNAVKFNREEGSVTVEALQKENVVEVCVSDTGIGIPEDRQDKIFERFYQVDGGITRRYGGVGMGLAIVKEIIEAQGGMVKVESELGRGSKFYVTIPLWRGSKPRRTF